MGVREQSGFIHGLLCSPLFWFGLAFKVVLSVLFASEFLIDYFIPFADYFVGSGFQNPYKHFSYVGHKEVFPYPAFMLYIFSMPMALMHFISASPLYLFSAKISMLAADFVIMLILHKLTKSSLSGILFYYWLSPVLIYINYIHGQLDVIPIALLFISLYLLFKKRFNISALLFGLSLASKTVVILVLPLYMIYLIGLRWVKFVYIAIFALLVAAAFFLVNINYISDPYFLDMVFNNARQTDLFNFKYQFDDGSALYFAPLAYMFLIFTAVYLRHFNKDTYMMFLGFSFGIITLMVVPSPGWYYWIMPFFIYFHLRDRNLKTSLEIYCFFALQGLYCIYFAFFGQYAGVSVFLPWVEGSTQLGPFDGSNKAVENLVFTLLQGALLINCVFVYKNGIRSYSNYKILSQPFLLGICGDSGAGKTTIANAMQKIFTEKNAVIIYGDDMHKWERGNENWNNLTHLNPKSNFLHEEVSYLKRLKNFRSIYRRRYDHSTGKFTSAKKYEPNRLVIFEGLHSFYIRQMRELYDLKVFVQPTEELRYRWKIDRDSKDRGYSVKKILDHLTVRQKDSENFIQTQAEYANVIIGFMSSGDKDSLTLRVTTDNSIYLEPLLKEVSTIKTLSIGHEYYKADKQIVIFNGNITSDEIDGIASNLSISRIIEDIDIEKVDWQSDYIGLIQLIIVYCIVQKLDYDNL